MPAAAAPRPGIVKVAHTGTLPGMGPMADQTTGAVCLNGGTGAQHHAPGVAAGDTQTPMSLGPGVNVTYDVADVDGDGDEELLRLQGSAAKPAFAVVDGATGAVQWSLPLSNGYFLFELLDAADGTRDVLLFTYGNGGLETMQRRSGATGATRWSWTIGGGGYWGIAAGRDDHLILTGRRSSPSVQLLALDLTLWSARDGKSVGSVSLVGEGDQPSATVAGDLNRDGTPDLYTFEPVQTMGAAATGAVRAVSGANGAQLWTTQFAQPMADFACVLTAADMTGDGLDDAVMFSQWLGTPASPEEFVVSAVDGNGGNTAGISHAVDVTLGGFPTSYSSPGDADRDGKDDVIFAGPIYFPGTSQGAVLFESVGGRGLQWSAGPRVSSSLSDFRWGWWTEGGDVDGDGAADAFVLLGTSGGVQSAAPVLSATGAVPWQRSDTDGAFSVPAFADADGDGGDDIVDMVQASKVDFDWHITWQLVDGMTLEPFFTHQRVLDTSAGISLSVVGGSLRSAQPGQDIIVEHNMTMSSGRHFTEALDGRSGALLWSDPS